MLIHQHCLTVHLIKIFRVVKGLPIGGQEQSAHKQTIQPHLIRRYGLVKEASITVSLPVLYTGDGTVQRRFILLLTCAAVQVNEQYGRHQIIQQFLLFPNSPIRVDHIVGPILDIGKVLGLFRQRVAPLHPQEKNALDIVEVAGRPRQLLHRIGPDYSVAHLTRQCQRVRLRIDIHTGSILSVRRRKRAKTVLRSLGRERFDASPLRL